MQAALMRAAAVEAVGCLCRRAVRTWACNAAAVRGDRALLVRARRRARVALPAIDARYAWRRWQCGMKDLDIAASSRQLWRRRSLAEGWQQLGTHPNLLQELFAHSNGIRKRPRDAADGRANKKGALTEGTT